MCNKKILSAVGDRDVRVDYCIAGLIKWINLNGPYITVASCCGHGKYPPTIVVRDTRIRDAVPWEIFSNLPLPRTRNFYKRDGDGLYFIPETVGGELVGQ